tara:strand:- start:2044 stop:2292 length:249 start_codon:yes stop_codon:yes gene_type:complete
MKKTIVIVCILTAFFTGICLTSLLKKEKVIFVHKQCDEGKCISFKDLYMIEEGLDDIRYYTSMTGSEDKIVNRTREINQIIK